MDRIAGAILSGQKLNPPNRLKNPCSICNKNCLRNQALINCSTCGKDYHLTHVSNIFFCSPSALFPIKHSKSSAFMRQVYHFALNGHNLVFQPFHCCKLINESHTIKERKCKVFNHFFVEFYFATCVQCVRSTKTTTTPTLLCKFSSFAAPMHVLLLLLLLLFVHMR